MSIGEKMVRIIIQFDRYFSPLSLGSTRFERSGYCWFISQGCCNFFFQVLSTIVYYTSCFYIVNDVICFPLFLLQSRKTVNILG